MRAVGNTIAKRNASALAVAAGGAAASRQMCKTPLKSARARTLAEFERPCWRKVREDMRAARQLKFAFKPAPSRCERASPADRAVADV